ncbi:hypothetical protein ACWN8V_09040 [Vagococcus elongatus]|uniref:Uncharacterized protein n=1 Tax=Vagococcus elongatus TaxID=180344 RepID=A0A430ASL0_9ENTE|nr:hypothetical protein [Vagococcus elongatus]RSU11052.1 hypothetical protein CBF29_08810 [Vagococcus elongatus]
MDDTIVQLLKSIDERLREMNETLKSIDDNTNLQKNNSADVLETTQDIREILVKWQYKQENPDANIYF